jgi:hypothetical protein
MDAGNGERRRKMKVDVKNWWEINEGNNSKIMEIKR